MNASLEALKVDLAEHAAALKADLDSSKPLVYAPVVWAYQDPRVRDAVAERLAAGQTLTSSSQAVPDRTLRRERVYFAFSPANRLDARVPGILVQLADDDSVVELIDPCEPDLLSNISVATSVDTLPLLASRSGAGSAAVTPDVEAQREHAARWSQFVSHAALGSAFGRGGFGGFGGGIGPFATTDTISGGVPTRNSPVMSEWGSKEDPDQDLQGAQFDDSAA